MLASLLFLVAAAAAGAEDSKSKSDDQKVVCKSERTVGSNMSQRVCKTREKWAEERERSRSGMNDVNARAGAAKPDGWYANGRVNGAGGAPPGPRGGDSSSPGGPN